MRMLIGRNAAARTIRRRSPDEIARGSRCSGSFILRTSRRGRYSHPSANLQPERVGGAALVDGEAQSPVRVGDEHQFASPGGPEGLKVPDRHLTIPDVDPHGGRSEEHTSELQSRQYLVCRLLLEKKKKKV